MIQLYERDARSVAALLEPLIELYDASIGRSAVDVDAIIMKILRWRPYGLEGRPSDETLRAAMVDRLTSIRSVIGEQLHSV